MVTLIAVSAHVCTAMSPVTCGAGSVLVRWLAGVAVAHLVQRQHSERVVDVGREVQVGRGAGARNLCQVEPKAWLVQQVLILDQKL